MGHLVEYLGSLNMDRDAEATKGPLFVLKGSYVDISRIHLLPKECIYNYHCILHRRVNQ